MSDIFIWSEIMPWRLPVLALALVALTCASSNRPICEMASCGAWHWWLVHPASIFENKHHLQNVIQYNNLSFGPWHKWHASTLKIDLNQECWNIAKIIRVVLCDGFQSCRWLVHSVGASNIEKGVLSLSGWPCYSANTLFDNRVKLGGVDTRG